MDRTRRDFLTGVALSAGAVAVGGTGCAQDFPTVAAGSSPAGLAGARIEPLQETSSRPITATGDPDKARSTQSVPLLSEEDFKYLGSYELSINGNLQVYNKGFTVRRVGAEVRFIVHSFAPNNSGPFLEFSIAGKSYGDVITQVTRRWESTGLNISMGEHPHETIWWDEVAQRLWVCAAIDYPTTSDAPSPTNINTMILGAGRIEALKRISLEGVPDRRAKGPVMTIPPAEQVRWGYGPYAIGFGGYTSRMSVGGQCAMGLSVFAMPDPEPYPSGSIIPARAVKTMATRGITPRGRRIWYGFDWKTLSGKGPINYFDGGDPRGENPPYPPTTPPIASVARWQSPAADGKAYWTGQGGGYSGGFYISGERKRGVVVVGTFPTGRTYYMSSSGYSDGMTAEIHVFDPEFLGEVSQGKRRPDSIEPSVMRACPEADLNHSGVAHSAAYDPQESRLYIHHGDARTPSRSRIHVYQVNA